MRIGIVAVLVLAFASAASAQDAAQLELSFEGPLNCPDAEGIRALTFEYLSGHPSSMRPLSARVRVIERDGSFLLSLSLVDGASSASRELAASSCELAARAAALILAFAIDPTRVNAQAAAVDQSPSPDSPRHTEATTPANAPRAANTQVVPTPRTTVDHAHSPPAPIRFAFSAFASLAGASLPRVAPGLGGEITLSFSRFELSTGASFHFASHAYVDSNEMRGASFSRWLTNLSLGYRIGLQRWSLVPRIGLSIGEVVGQGVGLSDPTTGRRLWLSPTVGIGLRYRVSDLIDLVSGVTLEVPLARPQFEVTGLALVHEVPALTGAMTLGFAVRLP